MKYKLSGIFVIAIVIGYFIGTATEKNTKQDFYCTASNVSNKNSLKGLSNFLFFSMIPKSYTIIEKELQNYGNVREIELLSVKEEGIEFKQVESDATFTFTIKETGSSSDENSSFVIASLTLNSFAVVKKTKEEALVTIWSDSCIFPKNQDNDELLTQNALTILMNMFMNDYSTINTTQPTFQLVIQK